MRRGTLLVNSATSMEKAKAADKPFFIWWNSTKMHIFTHLADGVSGKTGLGIYADGMVEHYRHVGELLAKLDELGLSEVHTAQPVQAALASAGTFSVGAAVPLDCALFAPC